MVPALQNINASELPLSMPHDLLAWRQGCCCVQWYFDRARFIRRVTYQWTVCHSGLQTITRNCNQFLYQMYMFCLSFMCILHKIGVGDEVNINQLMDVASEPHEFNIYLATNFSAMIEDIANQLSNTLCNSKYLFSTPSLPLLYLGYRTVYIICISVLQECSLLLFTLLDSWNIKCGLAWILNLISYKLWTSV